MCIRSDDRKGVLVISCFHQNARTITIGGSCNVEELIDYCPDCHETFNYRIEI